MWMCKSKTLIKSQRQPEILIIITWWFQENVVSRLRWLESINFINKTNRTSCILMIKKGIRTLLKKINLDTTLFVQQARNLNQKYILPLINSIGSLYEHLIINHHTITILVFPQSLTGFAFLRISILWKQIDICLMMSTTSMN